MGPDGQKSRPANQRQRVREGLREGQHHPGPEDRVDKAAGAGLLAAETRAPDSILAGALSKRVKRSGGENRCNNASGVLGLKREPTDAASEHHEKQRAQAESGECLGWRELPDGQLKREQIRAPNPVRRPDRGDNKQPPGRGQPEDQPDRMK